MPKHSRKAHCSCSESLFLDLDLSLSLLPVRTTYHSTNKSCRYRFNTKAQASIRRVLLVNRKSKSTSEMQADEVLSSELSMTLYTQITYIVKEQNK
jgi:hypothetical protein